MNRKIAIHWFRQDLRLLDNPSLNKASEYKNVLPIYILDKKNSGCYFIGSASRWWLHESLKALSLSLGGNISIYCGNPKDILSDLIMRFEVRAVCWNRCYEPWQIDRDIQIKEWLKRKGVNIHIFNSSLLWEPWHIVKSNDEPYRVFTPFYRKGCLNNKVKPRIPLSTQLNKIVYVHDTNQTGLNKLDLLSKSKWYSKLSSQWEIGETEAIKKFKKFIDKENEAGINSYKDGRNFMSKKHVSRLSPHIHFGEISPHWLWHNIRKMEHDKDVEHFCSELCWREFSYNQLYFNREMPTKNLQQKFDNFPWLDNTSFLSAWQKGKTGIPMVDAGMRELWRTGYMHNRSRMIVGSFLVKNLRLHWHHGKDWFWNTLVDADLANNSASWQWIAGCGLDAAPYFRIFNPVTQGKKFDPDGNYVRHYIPEIASLPNQYIFSPWEAPESILQECNIKLGKTYPYPIVDLKQSRESALAAFQSIGKEKNEN